MLKSLLLIIFLNFSVLSLFAQELNLLPPIPEPSSNPHLRNAFDGVKVGNFTFNKSFSEAEEILLAIQAYLHPSSPHKGQKPVLDRLLFLLDKILTGWDDGTMALNDMQFCFQANLSYLMLKQYEPSAIPTASQAKWESGIRKNVTAILAAKPDMYDRHIVGSIWLNGDVRLALGVYFAGITLNDAVAKEKARIVIEELMPRTLLSDGATHYVGYSNESPSYHGEATIRPFAWYYIFTKSQAIRNFITGTDKYIPLVHVPVGEGYREWSTSPAWKPYYNRVSLRPEALAKAYISGDSYNFEIGKGSQMLFLAFLYRSGLTAKTLPDNYMLFDRNTLGARGRYGNWGVVATLRDPSVPSANINETRHLNMDGNNTLVGAFTLNADAASNAYPLNAAFHGTAPQVKFAAGVETDFARGNKWAFLTGKDMFTATTKSKQVYGHSASYLISKRRFAEQKWQSNQLWVVTPDRVIGIAEALATETNAVYGLAHRIQLVSGRRNASGVQKTLITNDFRNFEYGDLRVRIHDKDYLGKVDTFYHGVMTYLTNDQLDKRSVMIELHDDKSANDALVSYPAGHKRFVLLETTNKDRAYAQNVLKRNYGSGLVGFEFTETNNRKVWAIYNPNPNATTLSAQSLSTSFANARVIKSWANESDGVMTVLNNSFNLGVIQLPAYSHIIVVSSNSEIDMENSFNVYENVFIQSPTSSSSLLIKNNEFDIIVRNRNVDIINKNNIKLQKLEVFSLDGKLINNYCLTNNDSSIVLPPNLKGRFLLSIRDLSKVQFSKSIVLM